tara:strand:- start:172 stop:573 length:402 start_codon:yes stop_codon:yes gene_type:complete
MSKVIQSFNSLAFLSIGAILGTYFRVKISDFINLFFSKKYLGTLVVNNLATFLFAFLISLKLNNSIFYNSEYILIAIYAGFLSSLSTFSTFIIELLESFLSQQWSQFYSIFLYSIFGAILAGFIGYKLGHAAI